MRVSLLFAILTLPASAACAQGHNVASLAPKLDMAAAAAGNPKISHPISSLHESIKIQLPESPAEYAADQTPTLQTTMGHNSTQGAANVALSKWTPIEVPAEDAAVVANKTLAVKMIVNGAGEPELLQVVDSVNPEFDQLALNTLKQYRFTPASIDYLPVAAPVVVRVSFEAK